MARIVHIEASEPTQVDKHWICACGLTGNAPFCDGSHTAIPKHEDGRDVYRRAGDELVHVRQ